MPGTIAAVATPHSAGGIGIIRISGDDAVKIASRVFRCADGGSLESARGYTARYGRVFDSEGDIDEAVALVFRAPKSYTGENVVELSCHGGLAVVSRALRSVIAAGAKLAEAGEFTKRAFLNGKIDLTEAEAVMGIISANSEQAARAALSVRDGVLSRKTDGICTRLINSSAHMAAWVDYPEDDLPELDMQALSASLKECLGELNSLLAGYDGGRAVLEGVPAVIAGRPNAGKSSLMNFLSGRERSIVTPVAGTTRDIVEETVRLGDVLLRLADTAGLRETDDLVESIGVGRAKELLTRAELIFAVFDLSSDFTEEDAELCRLCENRKAIAVLNKSDLAAKMDTSVIEKSFAAVVTFSAETGEGAENLRAAAEKLLGADGFDPSAPFLENERQRDCCKRAAENLGEAVSALECGMTMDAVNVLIDCACDALLEMTGKKAGEEVLSAVFSRFCVGK